MTDTERARAWLKRNMDWRPEPDIYPADEALTDLIAAVRREERGVIRFLWSLLDHIDTLDDAIKADDAAFRDAVRRAQQRRWETGIATDGYSLAIPGEWPAAIKELGDDCP